MTLRDSWDAVLAWVLTFWQSVTTQSVLDWPLSYFAVIFFGGLVAFYVVIMVIAGIAIAANEATRRK